MIFSRTISFGLGPTYYYYAKINNSAKFDIEEAFLVKSRLFFSSLGLFASYFLIKVENPPIDVFDSIVDEIEKVVRKD